MSVSDISLSITSPLSPSVSSSPLDYYRILGVTRSSTSEEIRSAYRQLAKKYFHSETKEKTSNSQFCQISEAFDVLNNEEFKSIYDHYGYQQLQEGFITTNGKKVPPYQFSSRPFNSIQLFENTFGHTSPHTDEIMNINRNLNPSHSPLPSPSPIRCPPIHVNLYISFEEYVICSRKSLKFTILHNGISSDKTIFVRIESGWKEGQIIVMSGEGNRESGKEDGDVIIHLVDKPHPLYKRHEIQPYDLVYIHSVSLCSSLCGLEFPLVLLDKRVLPLGFHQILTPKTVKLLEGEGLPMPMAMGNKRGSVFIHFDIQFPTELSEKEKNTIRSCLEGRGERE